jgi:hypothetical protein
MCDGYFYTDQYGYKRYSPPMSQEDMHWMPPLKKATAKQQAVLKALQRKPKRGVVSNCGTHYSKRKAYAHTSDGIRTRRALVKAAAEEIEGAKTFKVHVKGQRRRKKAAPWEVQKVISVKKRLKFSLNTIRSDMRALAGASA